MALSQPRRMTDDADAPYRSWELGTDLTEVRTPTRFVFYSPAKCWTAREREHLGNDRRAFTRSALVQAAARYQRRTGLLGATGPRTCPPQDHAAPVGAR